jgi:tetratricopeptide (TPR) repeat protein
MKKLILIFILFLSTASGNGQAIEVDSLRKLLATTTEDTVRIDVLCDLSFYEQNFHAGLKLAKEALALSKKIGYKKGECSSLFQMGNQYLTVSNSTMALHYFLEALKISEEINDKASRGACYMAIGLIYKEQGDYPNALGYLQKAESSKPDDKEPADLAYGMALLYVNFGDVYLRMNQQDSALKYFLRSYEFFNSADIQYQLNLALNGLGSVQLRMGNTEIALGYYRQAVRNAVAHEDTVGLSDTYLLMAQLFEKEGQRDSSIIYGEMAIENAQRVNAFKNVSEAGRLLSRQYNDRDDKLALRYLVIAQLANDSLFNTQKITQLQNMFLSEADREASNAEKEQHAAEQRRQNLEYAAIAIFIITFIILFLIISRSIIVTERWISFFGILGLLTVFEFINLLIHPALARITHESPVFLLMAYVVVASLLIPVHHRLEKWILVRVTEKNRKIRLENARKTIEELEAKEVNAPGKK